VAKRVKTIIKLQIEAGKASPAPPIGTALGPHGVNIMGFVKEYNERTSSQMGSVIPVVLTIFEDSSFTFELRTPPAGSLLAKAAGIEKGSGEPHVNKVGTVSEDKIREIAEQKMKDLNAADIEGAIKIIEGTARSMGLVVENKN
tara:strand:- start:344 stop:775 length:432 start_codon:yes stop_codon:yes gene_type:complete